MRTGTFSFYDMESWIELRSGLLTSAKTMSRFDFLDDTGKFGQTERRKGKKVGGKEKKWEERHFTVPLFFL